MKLAMILGLALIAAAWLQATALVLNSAGIDLPTASALNVYSGWFGAGLAVVAASALIFARFRPRTENI